MSKLFGIGIEVTFEEPFPFTDDWVSAVYTSLERNMVIKSVDLFLDEDAGKMSFILGVKTFLDDSPEAASDLANEAVELAFRSTGDEDHTDDRVVTRSEVLQDA